VTTRGNQTDYELPDSESVTYNPGFDDNGKADERDPLLVPGKKQDISQREKTTLGNYLNNLTAGRAGGTRPNSFTVPGGSNSTDGSGHTVSTDASSNQGPALTLSQMRSAGTTNGTFTDLTQGLNKPAIRKFEDTKNSEYGRGQSPFKDTDIKNFNSEARRRGQDGNSLLSSIQAVGEGPTDLGVPRVGEPPETAPITQKKISEVIKTNRFNPIDKPFVQNHSRTDIGYTVQKQLGKYDSNANTVIGDRLSKIGLNVMLSAAGIPDGKNFLPGIPTISTADMRAQSVDVSGPPGGADSDQNSESDPLLKNISPYKSFRTSEYTNDSTGLRSYGNMSSPIEPFSVAGTISDFRNSAALSGAVFTIYEIVKLFEKKRIQYSQRLPLIRVSVGIDVESPLAGMTVVGTGMDFSQRPGYQLAMGKHRLKKESDSEADQSNPLLQVSAASNFLDRIVEAYKSSIPETEHAIGDCILRGSTIMLNQIRKGSSGYFAALARSVSRGTYSSISASIESIASSFTNLRSIFSQGLISNFLSVATSIESIFNQIFLSVESLFSSSLYKFVISLAQIGDRSLIAERERQEREDARSLGIVDQPSIQASRLSDFDIPANWNDLGSRNKNALAWKHSSTTSRYILPLQLRDAARDYGAVNEKFAGLNPDFRDRSSSWSNRLSSDEIKGAETILDAEYMPFYFHDIRTNEIISFHAFLGELSDGFNASYESVAGYGRGDEVMTYKSTKRSISLSFFAVATSEEDLDVMYWNINKLISMLYPQYSRGRAMKSGNDRFLQPFSQIPTASPLIRLRVGDIISTNYSKFGIARLFGLGESGDVFSPKPPIDPAQSVEPSATPTVAPPISPPQSTASYAVGQVITVKPGIPTVNRFLDQTGKSVEEARSQLSAASDPAAQVPESNPGAAITNARTGVPIIPRCLRTIPRRTRAKILKVEIQNGEPIYQCEIIRIAIVTRKQDNSAIRAEDYQTPEFIFYEPGSNRGNSTIANEEGVPYMIQRPEPVGNVELGPTTTVITRSFLRRLNNYRYMSLTESEIVRPRVASSRESSESPTAPSDQMTTAAQVSSPTAPSAPNAINLAQFLSTGDNGNPVIKSFETTIGKGLAGFITDLKFDWGESTWEIEPGKRAPKFMKIDISFSPIHDIPMGLDSNGALRSVAYNVGGLSKTVGDSPYESDV